MFGWNAVGRPLFHELTQLIKDQAADMAAVRAAEALFELLARLEERNATVPLERRIHVRAALHFGEVDVLEGDREGPHVTHAFRVESISSADLPGAADAIDTAEFPTADYVLCTEHVADIVGNRRPQWQMRRCGIFKLEGTSGRWELFFLRPTAVAA